MSLSLNFEPHTWYKQFAIKNNKGTLEQNVLGTMWYAVTDDGYTGYLVEIEAKTLREVKGLITQWHNHRLDNFDGSITQLTGVNKITIQKVN